MAKYVYYVIADHGDGSAGVRYFDGEKYTAEQIGDFIDDDDNCETYGQNEGQVGVFVFPDDLDLKAVGFRFSELPA